MPNLHNTNMKQTADQWLEQLERVAPTHRARVQHMLELGRGQSSERDALLEVFNTGSITARLLVMYSAFTSRDGALVQRGLTDPARVVRGVAVTLAPFALSDETFQATITSLPEDQVLVLLHRWQRAQRSSAPVDAALLHPLDSRRKLLLLPFASTQAFKAHQRLLEVASASEWRRVARQHPDLISEQLRTQLGAATEFEARSVWQLNAVLPILAERAPDQALALLPLALRHASIAQLDLQALANRRPEAVADLMVSTSDTARIDWQRRAHLLPADHLNALLERHHGALPNFAYCLRRLLAAQRTQLHQRFAAQWRDDDGAIALPWLRLLPRELRQLEARRHLELPSLAARPWQRLPYAELLPWDEAKALLEPLIRHPDPQLRAIALPSLLGVLRFERKRAAEALELVKFRKNEQDPVRQVMLAQLAALPVAVWQSGQLEALGQIMGDALEAADVSVTTVSHMQSLIGRLLPHHQNWAIEWLVRLVQERGALYLPRLGYQISDTQAHGLAERLLPVLNKWFTRQREGYILQVMQSFGPRLRQLEDFAQLLERLVHKAAYTSTSNQAVRLLWQYQHARFVELAPALVQQDQSWILNPEVLGFLHRQRQDLLTPFLPGKVLSGRFASAHRAKYLLPLDDGFQRWAASQQKRFANTLEAITGEERDMPSLFVVVKRLSAIPEASPRRIIEMAQGSPKIHAALRDTALRALARLEEGRGLPTLLEALSDDRARIAIYALRQAVLEMPSARALELLRGVPQDKITVAKETLRLMGDLRSPEAHAELLRREAQDLHRDVRVALLRALWEYPESSETWRVLQRAALSSDAAIADGVIRIPAERLEPEAQRQLVSVLLALLGHNELRVRTDTLSRMTDLPITDRQQILLPRLLERLNSPYVDETQLAARAVLTTYAGGPKNAASIATAVSATRTNRKALRVMTQVLISHLSEQRTRMQDAARAFLQALELDPITASLRALIAVNALPWSDVAAYLTRLSQQQPLHPECSMGVVSQMPTLSREDTRQLADLELPLRDQADEGLRRIALEALLCAPLEWDAARLERLEHYRRDQSVLVAAAAQFFEPILGIQSASLEQA